MTDAAAGSQTNLRPRLVAEKPKALGRAVNGAAARHGPDRDTMSASCVKSWIVARVSGKRAT